VLSVVKVFLGASKALNTEDTEITEKALDETVL
jgi:hypothetical protein